jgi:hypothetical protein
MSRKPFCWNVLLEFHSPGDRAECPISRLAPLPACDTDAAAVGPIDYVTANDLVVTLFYLLPPSIGTWCVSRPFGFALAGAVNQVLETSSHGAYVLILNTAVEGGVFVAVVLLLAVSQLICS